MCHSKNYSTTLAAYIYNPTSPETYIDRNSVKCFTCGWTGICHDLVPRPEKTAFKIGILGDTDEETLSLDDTVYKTEQEAKQKAESLQNQDKKNLFYVYEVESK